jgi:hypothetical protein
VQLAAAQARGAHAQDDLAVPWLWVGKLDQFDLSISAQNCATHNIPPVACKKPGFLFAAATTGSTNVLTRE